MKLTAKKLVAVLMTVAFMACGTGAFAAESAKCAPEQKQEQKTTQKTTMKKATKDKKTQNKKMQEKKSEKKPGASKKAKEGC